MVFKSPKILVVVKIALLTIVISSMSFKGNAQYAKGYRIPDSTFLWSHSPHKATFLSAIVPGLGQIYNEKYWKVPLIYAGFGSLFYYSSYNNSRYKFWKTAYQYETDNDTTTVNPYPFLSEQNLLRRKDTWRRYRDLCYIGIGILYVAQIIDADVDAHLFDYDIGEDLSMRIEPTMIDPRQLVYYSKSTSPVGLRCTIRF